MNRAIVDLDDCPRSVETTGMREGTWNRSRAIGGALAIGGIVAAISWAAFPFTHGADFAQFHFHARNWLAGRDPYVGGFPIMRRTRIVPEPLFYPFPTLFVLAPFALLPLRAAMALFVGCSTALLSWGILAKSPERLPMLLGAGFILASGLGQWTPLVTATLLMPTLGFLAVVKPNVGLASVADDPSANRILGGGALLLLSLAFLPSWPSEWLHNLRSMPGIRSRSSSPAARSLCSRSSVGAAPRRGSSSPWRASRSSCTSPTSFRFGSWPRRAVNRSS